MSTTSIHTCTTIATRLTLGTLSLALVACGPGGVPPEPPPDVLVITTLAKSSDIPNQRIYPGQVYATDPVTLVARVEGYLEKQHVADGAMVTAGQVVYTIQQDEYEASLAKAEGQLAKSIAQRDLAKIDVERNRPLAEAGAISKQDFDKLLTQLASAEAEVVISQAQVTIAKLNLSYCTVLAPVAGKLGASQQFVGDLVAPGQQSGLNTVMPLDPIWVQFSPADEEWPQYQQLMAKGGLKATVSFGMDQKIQTPGTLILSDNQIDASTGSLMMRAELANANGTFLPGLFVEVAVQVGTYDNAVLVPMEALMPRQTLLVVWRVKADNTVESVIVEVQRVLHGQAILKPGAINVGDRVVTSGVQKLREGVKVAEAAPAAAATTPAATGHGKP